MVRIRLFIKLKLFSITFISFYKAHKISNEMFFIDWVNQNMSEIDCQHRGLHEIVAENFFMLIKICRIFLGFSFILKESFKDKIE